MSHNYWCTCSCGATERGDRSLGALCDSAAKQFWDIHSVCRSNQRTKEEVNDREQVDLVIEEALTGTADDLPKPE